MAKAAGRAGRGEAGSRSGASSYLTLNFRKKGTETYKAVYFDISKWRSIDARAVGFQALDDVGYSKIVVRDSRGVTGIAAFRTSANLGTTYRPYTYIAWLAGEAGGGIQALAAVGKIAAELHQEIHLVSLAGARPFYKIMGFKGAMDEDSSRMIMSVEDVVRKWGERG